MVYMYIDIDIVCSACGSCCVGLWCSVFSVCWLGLLVSFVLCWLCCAMRALLSVVIWCTRVIMRCNRFSVLGGVVFTLCALVRL